MTQKESESQVFDVLNTMEPQIINNDPGEYELAENGTFDRNQSFPPSRMRLASFIDRYGTEKAKSNKKHSCRNSLKQCRKFFNLINILNFIVDRIPMIRCLKEYEIRKNLFGDVAAGVTVAIMHIPQGMAYGVLTTLPAVYGLYVSFYPVLVYAFLGTCPHLSIGTFAVISLMIAQAINGIPLTDSNSIQNFSSIVSNSSEDFLLAEKLSLATSLAFLVGIVQLILSFLQLGFLTVYLTEPFISGFTSASAIHVFSSQVPPIFGVPSPKNVDGAFKLPKFYYFLIKNIFTGINWVSTAIGLSSMIVLYIAKFLNERYKSKIRIVIPNELILVIIGTSLSYALDLNEKEHVSVVGPIKRGFPSPVAPGFRNISSLIVPSISIAVVSLSISISMGKMFSRKHGYHVRSNQELFAYGMSNVVSSFFLCYPSAGSLSRSVVQEGSGCKSQLVGIFSCVLLGTVILVLTPVFRSLPMSCLAAIILINLKGLLLQTRDVRFYYRISKIEFILWISTFLVTVLFDVDIGLYAGLAISFLLNTVRTQKPRFSILGQVGQTGIYKNVQIFPSAQQYPMIRIVRFDESLYACNAPFFKRKFYELIGIELRQEPLIRSKNVVSSTTNNDPFRFVVLDCSPFNFIDSVGVKLLIEIYNDLQQRKIQFFLAECRYDVRRTFDQMEFYEKTSRIIYITTHDAVITAQSMIVSENDSMPSAEV